MNTEETLKFKALALKAEIENESGRDLLDHFIDKNPEAIKKAMRNICAFISPELFKSVEVLCDNLRISKRQVVEMALIDFMSKADQIMKEVDPFANVATDEDGRPLGSEVEGE